MKFEMGDIVIPRSIDYDYPPGLYEVAGTIGGSEDALWITNDFDNSELGVHKDHLILVCRAADRKDEIFNKDV